MGYWKLGIPSPRIGSVRSFERVKMPKAEGWIHTKIEMRLAFGLYSGKMTSNDTVLSCSGVVSGAFGAYLQETASHEYHVNGEDQGHSRPRHATLLTISCCIALHDLFPSQIHLPQLDLLKQTDRPSVCLENGLL